ncbi:MAG TPA: hypothetical protein VEQ85_13410, partial [Lacipirellulaceae bacterium]|nr:hypothetical protein [Lacipirellulaceae bacterium]
EIVGEDGPMMGWLPRIGERGAVAIAKPPGSTGGCLHLRSEDVLGVAAQSLLFPMPGTGQLAIRAKVRVRNMAPEARVYVWIECHAPEPLPLRYVPLEGELAGDGVTCEVGFDDMRLASSGQMKVQFHLAGTGEAWIDEVELFDLRFANAHRKELGKRLYAARNALEQGWIVDCQRLVDSYWPRYLVEYLPPASGSRVSVATLPQSAAPPKPEPASESPRMTDRVRESLPRLWK